MAVKKEKKVTLYFSEDHESIHNNPVEFTVKKLKDLSSRVCKPCWELRYCPYGLIVEDFPLPPMSKVQKDTHIDYLKTCLKQGKFGNGQLIDEKQRAVLKKEISEFDSEDNSVGHKELSYMACSTFGHLCPVYFVAEGATETLLPRKSSRYITQSVLVRVVRRDNSMCQLCSRVLLDADIEIDHIIPVSKGGPTHESNLRVLCKKCNRSKSSKLDDSIIRKR